VKTRTEVNEAVNKLWDIDPKAEKSDIVLMRETLEWVLGDTAIVDDVISDYTEE